MEMKMKIPVYPIEMRTRVYPTEARSYCANCAVFLDSGQPKNPNLTYLPKKEFDKINDHIMDDSVLNAFTVDQILSIMASIKDFDGSFQYFSDQKDKTDPTVKFFGEMTQSGLYQKFMVSEEAGVQKFQALHHCSNPSCKVEINLPAEYPYYDQTVGRMIRSPAELQHPDNVIKNVMKKHVGSTINSNFKDVNAENTGKDVEAEKEK